MSDQSNLFDQPILTDSRDATSSAELQFGIMPSTSRGGRTKEVSSSLVPVPANPSARPAKVKRSTTKGIYGQSSFDSSKHDDLSFALASRLRPLTDLAGSTLFSLTWTVRVTPAGRSICALRASEPRTEGSVCIGWPTPQVNDDNNSRRSPESMERWLKRDKHSSELGAVASLAGWPTPVANDDNKTPEAHLRMKLRMGERDGSGANRTAITSLQVMAQLAGWKTPTACSPNSLRGQGQEPADRQAGGHAVNIQDQVRLTAWKTPCVPNGGRISGNQTDIGKHQDGTKAQIGLENEARLSGWTTPQAHDQTGRSKGQKEIHGTLHGCACLVSEARLTAFGETPIGYLLGPNGWEIRPASGQLNAAHSRWLMGLPKDWDQAGIAAFRLRKARKREL